MTAKSSLTYSKQEETNLALKLNHMLDELPRFCTDYFNSLEFTKQPRTKIAYARDIKVFFEFLHEARGPLQGKDISELTIHDLDKITGDDISDFLRHAKVYEKNGQIKTNGERAIKRKLCSVRGFF